MTTARIWRPFRAVDGPFVVRDADINPINQVFSDAFTERYRRDGMAGVRVPQLHTAIWRYALADAGDGAMLWRDERGEVAAFNITHCSGSEGWMGPLAVRPDCQAAGAGKAIVRAGMDWLVAQGARTIGLETMPRTMDNIGFYSTLGFRPERLTLTVTLEAASGGDRPALLSHLDANGRAAAMAECRDLLASSIPGYDFTREIGLTGQLGLGDTLLLRHRDGLAGFALCHTVPLVDGRASEELRVLKLAIARDANMDAMVRALRDFAKRSGARRVALRVQGEYIAFLQRLITLGARVRWTDLRMTAHGYPEPAAAEGVVLSNWEI